MNENNKFRNKLMINSATSISLGNICWFGLDTKLVGRIKALLEENEKLKNDKKKLIEYLKLFDKDSDMINHSIIRGALNILQGDDNK